MEDLTKQQIVLVTLLVSFVTSIATGIVAVSLMDQAPKGVTQTINQVVERTIEKVVPAQNQAAAIVTKETVVVSTEDQVIKAVDANLSKVVKVQKFINGQLTSTFLAEGLIVSRDGFVLSDFSIADPNATYEVILSDGTHTPLILKKTYADTGLALFKITEKSSAAYSPTVASSTPRVFDPVHFADSSTLKLGQNVLVLSGKESNIVSLGIIQSLKEKSATSSSSQEITATVEQNQTLPGSPLISLNGSVVGIKTSKIVSDSSNIFLGANAFKESFAKDI